MTTTTDTRVLRYLGGMLACGEAKCIEEGDEYIIKTMGGATHRIAASARPSWIRYAHRGRPAGRRKTADPRIYMSLGMPSSLYNRVPTPRQAWIRQVVEERLCERRDRDMLPIPSIKYGGTA